MNVLSLFDGHSTGYQALKEAEKKIDVYFASEIEKAPIKISCNNFPDIVHVGDVTKIHCENGNLYKDCIREEKDDVITWKLGEKFFDGKIDLLIGGSPCQGFSRAGKCLNFSDPRSVLFFEYVRILEEIRAVNPEVKFLLENVRMAKEWRDVITGYMGVEPYFINSRMMSAQQREREYWTNIPLTEVPDLEVRLVDILEEVDTTDYIEKDGILFDPTFSEKARELVSVVDGEVHIKQATKQGYIVANDGDGINLDFPTSKSRRGRAIKEKASTITRVYNSAGVYHNGVIRKFTITELERLQTLPDGYTKAEGVTEKERQQAIGNGWTTSVITHIFKNL